MTKDQILAALPQLSPADLSTVATMATHLLGAAGAVAEQGATTPQQAVFDALVAALGVPVTYKTWRGTTAGKKFDKDVPALLNWLSTHFKGWDASRIKEQALLRMVFDLMVASDKARNIQLTLARAAVSLGQLPRLVEDSFPGYLEAGMGFMILKKCQ